MSLLRFVAHRARGSFLFCLLALLPALGWAQTVNDACDPNTDFPVRAVAVQPDGKILVAGDFGTIAGSNRLRLVRLNVDCTLDTSFIAVSNDGNIHAVLVQADGRIVIGGAFNQVHGSQARSHIARLNANGSPDLAFTIDADGDVDALAQQPDGKLLVGGKFFNIGGVARGRFARLNAADGSVDTSFTDLDAEGGVHALMLQPDGKLVLGGSFSGFSVNSGPITPPARLARLNVDGTLDAGFNPNPNNSVNGLALQPDGKIVVGGGFNQIGPFPTIGRLARVNPNGTVDDGFDPSPDGPIAALALQPDGKLLLAGTFTSLNNGVSLRNNLARLNVNGSVDNGFDPDVDNVVVALAVQPDGKVFAGGAFTHQAGIPRNHIVRLYADGTTDGTYNPDVTGTVSTLAVQPDHKLVIGGNFTALANGTVTRNNVARLDGDGNADGTFDPNASGGTVGALAVQRDAAVVLAGGFTALGGTTRNRVGRIGANNALDGFDPNVSAVATPFINTLALHPDTSVLIGGLFSTLAPNGGAALTRNNIALLNPDGTASAIDPNANNRVRSAALLPDGDWLVVGDFGLIGGGGRSRLAKLNPDGSLDSSFTPNFGAATVRNALVQPDGKIVVSGDFTTVNSQPHLRIVRLEASGAVDGSFGDPKPSAQINSMALQLDGKVVLGGAFTNFDNGNIVRNGSARLEANGVVDATFDPNVTSGSVNAVALQQDGKIVLGGTFITVGGVNRNHLARLSATESALQSLALGTVYSNGGASITWLRSGAGPELAQAPVVQVSFNGVSYDTLAGTMRRIAGGWRFDGFVPQFAGEVVSVRVSAPVSGGQNNGSSGLIASERQFFVPADTDGIFANDFE